MAALPQRMLYVGQLRPGSTSAHRARAAQDLGIELVQIDTHPEAVQIREATFAERVRKRLFGPRDLAGVNPAMLEAARRNPFDVIWIDRGTTVERRTLAELRAIRPDARLVHYNPDDPFGEYGMSEFRKFMKAIPEYDVHLVPRKPNVGEYLSWGAKRVEQIVPFWGYDPETHRPLTLNEDERRHFGAPVGFIGMAERERARSITRLAREGFSVKVWGNRWPAFLDAEVRSVIAGPAQFGETYAKVISAFDINLAFLRKQNRDEHTSRSVELPAAGAFMLAERTDEHLQLFEEGREAEFFASDDELVDKVRYYGPRPDERARIAATGRQRGLRDGYDNRSVVREMLSRIM
jgi:spore maturation protein CgeB